LWRSTRRSGRARPLEDTLSPQEKKAEFIQQEVAREVERLLRVIFGDRRKSGRLDLKAVEMVVRSALHQAGAAMLSKLLRFPVPKTGQRTVACACGQQAQYRELRSKPLLTAVGPAQVARASYLCPHCHTGRFPADVELDIERTEFSPGVRRVQAMVGHDAPFEHSRQQLQLLAGLEVTAKSVERVAEAIATR